MKLQCFNPSAAPTRVVFVRHGRSTYNDQGRYQGASDASVLTAQGRQDAFQTGLALKKFSFSALYTSPLLRTQQTAQEILAAFHFSRRSPIPINVHRDLKEIDLPLWEGLPYRHVRETLTDDYRCWIESPHTFEMLPLGSGVSPRRPVQSLYAQARRFWRQVLPRHAGQKILVVSHGGTIKALLSEALGVSCRQFHALQQSNCGISVLNFPYQQPACLESVNDTSHLGEILPKLKAGRQGLRLLLVPDTVVSDFRPLQALLDQVEMTFSVSNGESAQRLAKALLSQSPQTVQLQTNRTDISYLWLQALNKRQILGQTGAGVLTGLVVAKPKILQEMLSQVVGADSALSRGLSLAAGRVSIVHYAKSQPLPILQAMNFADFTFSRRGSMLCAS